MMLGIDVVIMSMIALLCIVAAIFYCKYVCVEQKVGELMVVSASITAFVMVLGYIIMSNILDYIIGLYW